MRRNTLPYIALGLIIILGALHFIAEAFYLYWTIWWFDNIMHLLAGFAGGFIIVWLLFSSLKYRLSNFKSVLLIIASVLLIGVAWEIFEYVNGIAQSSEDYVLDTSLDLFFDVLGASLASFVGVRWIFRLKN